MKALWMTSIVLEAPMSPCLAWKRCPAAMVPVRFIYYQYPHRDKFEYMCGLGCQVESGQAYMGDVVGNSPTVSDIDACIRHCARLTNYWSIQPLRNGNGKCWCKKSIMKRRTRKGWFSGSTSCHQIVKGDSHDCY